MDYGLICLWACLLCKGGWADREDSIQLQMNITLNKNDIKCKCGKLLSTAIRLSAVLLILLLLLFCFAFGFYGKVFWCRLFFMSLEHSTFHFVWNAFRYFYNNFTLKLVCFCSHRIRTFSKFSIWSGENILK